MSLAISIDITMQYKIVSVVSNHCRCGFVAGLMSSRPAHNNIQLPSRFVAQYAAMKAKGNPFGHPPAAALANRYAMGMLTKASFHHVAGESIQPTNAMKACHARDWVKGLTGASACSRGGR